MTNILPPSFYRGDSDPNRERQLRSSWGGPSGVLLTGLANKGDPNEIFKFPLIESVRKHLNYDWDRTHFLSFSGCRRIARKYAAGDGGAKLVPANGENWQAAVFTIDTSNFFKVEKIEPGIFQAIFYGNSRQISLSSDPSWRHIRLFDVLSLLYTHLPKFPELRLVLDKARNDKEWLILP